MDVLKQNRRRNRISDTLYVLLNVGLVLAVFFSIYYVRESYWLPLVLVALSKWRVFAVRPRFWVANFLANIVDFIVGIGFVAFIYSATGQVWLQVAFAAMYAVWLLFVKPRSTRTFVMVQSGVALFVGLSALSMMTFHLSGVLFVFGAWVIATTAARHILLHYEDALANTFSLLWGVLIAQLAWISFLWQVSYQLPGVSEFSIAQFAIIATLLGFISEKAYISGREHGAVRQQDIMIPSVFSGLLIVVLIVMFNSPIIGA